ncbi:MAG: protein kinase [Vicinamibacterales bacterium]
MRESIGRYAVTGVLGEGGMGVVYEAFDRTLARPLAIKMLRPAAIIDGAARDRLLFEARSAASLNHPAICQLYEVGDCDGELYLAMELLQGESLAARLARGQLPVAEAGSTALGVLAGIEAIHRNGLVHRDLKPSNIFLTPHGVKVLDFGVATPMARPHDETALRLTLPGMTVGTPRYASPEQLQGQPADVRTDLFAMGLVLYEMLAGRPPFMGGSALEILHAMLYEQPPVLTGGPAVAALDRVIQRALRKEPAERYPTADAMAQDVRAALALGTTDTGADARPLTRLIVLPLRVLRPDPETDFLAFSLADAITSSLSGLQSLVVRSSAVAGSIGADAADVKHLAGQAQVDVVLMGTLLRAGPQIRVSTQLVDAAAGTVLWSHTAQAPVGDLFSLQDDLSSRIVDSLSLPLTTRERKQLRQDVPASPRAFDHFLRGNELSRAARHWTEALHRYEQALLEDPRYAPAWAELGRMQRMIGKYVGEDTSDRFARAESALKKALELNPDLTAAENIYAHLEVDLGRAEQAMVRLLTRARGRPADPELFAGLTHACRYCGLLTASLASAEQARRLDPRVRTSVAHTHFMLGQYDRVIEFEPEGIPYIRNLGLVMLGRTAEAAASLDGIDMSLANRMTCYTRSLRAQLRGQVAGAIEPLMELYDVPDPEARYYVARALAYLGQPALALPLLASVVEEGFFCLPAFARDPWLDSLRGAPEFSAITARAEARHRQAVISFLSTEGDRLLGAPHPV